MSGRAKESEQAPENGSAPNGNASGEPQQRAKKSEQAPANESGQPFEITGADGQIIAIPAGQFYFNTKARCRRMMLNSLSSNDRRVYACGELATMGFQQELAVTMERGKKRDLAPADISHQTGLGPRDVRESLENLENAGLAKREPINGKSLQSRQMRLYFWAEPHPTRPNIKNPAARGLVPDWFPPSWEPLKALITRLRLTVSISEEAARGLLEEGNKAARTYQNGLDKAARFLEQVCARPLYKDEITEITSERTASSSSVLTSAAEEPEKAGPGPQHPIPGLDPPQQQHPRQPPSEIAVVSSALDSQGCLADDKAAKNLIRLVRQVRPDATAREIALAIQAKGPLIKKADSPIGYALTYIPLMFEGENFKRHFPREEPEESPSDFVQLRQPEEREYLKPPPKPKPPPDPARVESLKREIAERQAFLATPDDGSEGESRVRRSARNELARFERELRNEEP